jgi:iron complex transport system ATP-binding protein
MILSVESLSVLRGREKILDSLNWSGPESELSFVLGPNGSGKTTLLKACSGLLGKINLGNGKIIIKAKPIQDYTPEGLAKKIHYVSSRISVHFPILVSDFLTISAHGFGTLIDLKGAQKIIERGSIAELLDRPLTELSAGELQRVNFIRALIFNPEILVLDEALSEVDIHHQICLMELLKEFCFRNRVAIMVSHDLGFIGRWFKSGILLKKGKIIEQGKTESLLTPASLNRIFPGYY